MRKRAVSALGAALVAAWPAPADAAWLHQRGNDDPFRGGAEHIVIASELDGYVAGFRCTSVDDLTLMLIVPEKPDATHLVWARSLPMKLLVIIDDGDKHSFDAVLETTPNLEKYRVSTDDEGVEAIAHAAAAARRRFALAAELNGKLLWSKSFRVAGSSRALKPLIAGCELMSGQRPSH